MQFNKQVKFQCVSLKQFLHTCLCVLYSNPAEAAKGRALHPGRSALQEPEPQGRPRPLPRILPLPLSTLPTAPSLSACSRFTAGTSAQPSPDPVGQSVCSGCTSLRLRGAKVWRGAGWGPTLPSKAHAAHLLRPAPLPAHGAPHTAHRVGDFQGYLRVFVISTNNIFILIILSRIISKMYYNLHTF